MPLWVVEYCLLLCAATECRGLGRDLGTIFFVLLGALKIVLIQLLMPLTWGGIVFSHAVFPCQLLVTSSWTERELIKPAGWESIRCKGK